LLDVSPYLRGKLYYAGSNYITSRHDRRHRMPRKVGHTNHTQSLPRMGSAMALLLWRQRYSYTSFAMSRTLWPRSIVLPPFRNPLLALVKGVAHASDSQGSTHRPLCIGVEFHCAWIRQLKLQLLEYAGRIVMPGAWGQGRDPQRPGRKTILGARGGRIESPEPVEPLTRDPDA
jgi:hypothetical protein